MAASSCAVLLLALCLLGGSPRTAQAAGRQLRSATDSSSSSSSPRLCGCPPINEPVCGSPDGGKTFQTYENKCFAGCAGVLSWTEGACRICSDLYSPVCGSNGVTYPNSCVAKNAGVPSWTEGACRSGLCGCPPADIPVCGTNNVTYSSPCVAQCEEGEEIAYYGQCTDQCVSGGGYCLLDAGSLPPGQVPANQPCCAGSKCIARPGHLIGEIWGMCSHVL